MKPLVFTVIQKGKLRQLLNKALHSSLTSPFKVFLVCSDVVDAAVLGYLNYAVCNCLHYLVVVGRKYHNALEITQAVVYSRYRLQVKVVGRSVKYKTVRTEEHHS